MNAYLMSLLESTLTMTILSCVLFALTPLLERRYSSRCLYALWMIALLGFAVPFRPHPTPAAIKLTLPRVDASSVPGEESRLKNTPTQTMPVEPEPPERRKMPMIDDEQMVFAIWLAGVLFVLARTGWQHARFMRAVRRWSRPVSQEEALRALARAKGRVGIRRRVRMQCCPVVDSPMLVGVFRPVILLPDLQLTGQALELVLCHELYHLLCGDIPVKLLMVWARALHWFNPILLPVGRALSYHCEASCDARVVQDADLDERQYYSETIIGVIRRHTGVRSALSTSYYGGVNGMKKRILSIMGAGGKRMGVLVSGVAVLLVLGTGMAVAVEPAPAAIPARAAPASLDAAGVAQGQDEPLVLPREVPYGQYNGTQAVVSGLNTQGTRLLSEGSSADWDTPLAVYYNGTPLTVYSVGNANEWVRVEVGEGTARIGGYMAMRDLAGTARRSPLPQGEVSAANASLLSDAMDGAPTLTTYPAGTRVRLLGRVGDWYHVEVEGRTAFMAASDVRIDASFAAAADALLPEAFELRLLPPTEEDRARWTFEDWAAAVEGHGVPRAEDISAEEALRIARETVQMRYGVRAEELVADGANSIDYMVVGADGNFSEIIYVRNERKVIKKPYYQVNLTKKDDVWAVYAVYLQPVTGEVLLTTGPGDGNG